MAAPAHVKARRVAIPAAAARGRALAQEKVRAMREAGQAPPGTTRAATAATASQGNGPRIPVKTLFGGRRIPGLNFQAKSVSIRRRNSCSDSKSDQAPARRWRGANAAPHAAPPTCPTTSSDFGRGTYDMLSRPMFRKWTSARWPAPCGLHTRFAGMYQRGCPVQRLRTKFVRTNLHRAGAGPSTA